MSGNRGGGPIIAGGQGRGAGSRSGPAPEWRAACGCAGPEQGV